MKKLARHIPNLLTLSNVWVGLIMIILVILDEWEACIIMMAVALFLDFADGFAARLLKASSELGKQLDSLADMVSFGVVPGLIMARIISESLGQDFPPSDLSQTLNSPIYMAGFIIPICAAFRLGRFNLGGDQKHFEGVPTPANAIWILSLWYLWENSGLLPTPVQNFLFSSNITYFLVGIAWLSGAWMIIRLPLLALKFEGWGIRKNIYRYLLIIVSALMLIIFQLSILPFIFLLYLAASLIAYLFPIE